MQREFEGYLFATPQILLKNIGILLKNKKSSSKKTDDFLYCYCLSIMICRLSQLSIF